MLFLRDAMHPFKSKISRIIKTNLMNPRKLSKQEKLRLLKHKGISINHLKDNDPQLANILADGTIAERRLFRRWITAQTLALFENSKGDIHRYVNDKVEKLARGEYEYALYYSMINSGFLFANKDSYNVFPYRTPTIYHIPKMWKIVIDEMHAQRRLMRSDILNYKQRMAFFNTKVLLAMLDKLPSDIKIESLKNNINADEAKGINAFTDRRIIADVSTYIQTLKFKAITVKVPVEFIVAYLKAGIFYSTQNLLLFNGFTYNGLKGEKAFDIFKASFSTLGVAEHITMFNTFLQNNDTFQKLRQHWADNYQNALKLID